MQLLRTGPTQNLNALDTSRRNRVQVGARVAPTPRAKQIDERRLVPALAIHQRLVGAEAAQARGVYVGGPIGPGLAVRVEGRGHELQQLVDVELASFGGYLLHVNDINRRGRVRDGAVEAALTY